MRILAIRGRNLASLAGDFEMRLDAPPLADAGLFAITGRTGAGKSTTLDALCLALFDRMPRLPGGRGVEVGRADEVPESRLRNNDVRSVLRRGAGEGYAEVDFRGVDGFCYRARWSVRRARERASGRFQAQTMELRNLSTGDDLSGNKMEVLAAIQARLGLTFDQFRRSVLLAQGDFAAFLRANAGERAELLERITGTGIYGEISRAAYRRSADEGRRLELVRQRLGDQCPLVEDERKALESELIQAQQACDQQVSAQQTLQRAQHWYQTLDKLASERDQAGQQLADARAAQDAAQPRRQAYERTRSLQPLRLYLAGLDQATDALRAAHRELESSIAQERDLQTASDRAEKEASAAQVCVTEAQKARDDGAPALRAARELDIRIQGARELTGRADADQELARRSLQEASAEQDRLQVDSDKEGVRLGQADDWLTKHAGIEPLAEHWDAWARELERYARARETLVAARATIETTERTGAVLAERRQAIEALAVGTTTDRGRVAAERSELESRAASLDLDKLAAQREERLARRGRVEQWRGLAERAREGAGHIQGTEKALANEQVRQANSGARLLEIEAELVPLTASLAEAREAHRRLLLASAGEVEKLRAVLQEGEPCPVCGAEEHPWVHPAPAVLEGLAADQAERVESLDRRSAILTAEKARTSAEDEQAGRRTAELVSELDSRRADLARTLETWSGLETDPLRPDDPFSDGLIESLTEELRALNETLEGIGREEAEARSLQAGIKAKTAEIEGLDTRLDSQRKELADLDEESRAGVEARDRSEHARAQAEETMAGVLALVAEPLAGIHDWRVSLEQDPEVFAAGCQREVDLWQQRAADRDEARRLLQDLAPRLAQAVAHRQAADQELARRSADLERHQAALAGLVRDRSGLLGGQPANTVEAKLNEATARASSKQEQSRLALAQAREALTTARGAVVTRRQALQEQEATEARARQALDARMAEQGVDLDGLREALKRDHDWIEQERIKLEALRDACDRSQELLKERERRMQEHSAAEPPELSPEALAQRLPLAQEALKTAQEHWGRLHGRLGEDDRRREASREIRAELERQQAVWELWESLRELIGAADGSKFRNFAQGLTLDLLVAHANEHLRDLARRYELQRVPGAEMEIQVIDREMGDEVRSIHSLSGGESFLVSLALALGLASLASDRVEVESLFIDEGFGALDADSLDLAIASLDALYSLGRQVGVISHVGTLVERIGVKVQVTKQGGGRSRLEVVAS